jgi:hypothetical protein
MLKCNLCEKYVIDRHVVKTESLWLRTINGHDYLVCADHRGGLTYEEKDAIGLDDSSRVSDAPKSTNQ